MRIDCLYTTDVKKLSMAILWVLYLLVIVGVDITQTQTMANISGSLRRKFENSPIDARANILVSMESIEQVLDKFNLMATVNQDIRRQTLYSSLKSYTTLHQTNIIRFLTFINIPFESFWISNQIYIPGATKMLVDQLSYMPGIEEIHEEQIIFKLNPKIDIDNGTPHIPELEDAQWNIKQIKVPQVWSSNYFSPKGEGIILGHIDTGVRWTHKTLKDNYRGDYGWFNPYDPKPNRQDKPHDRNCHGTHTMGTLAGSFGYGVAPGAKWMSCKGCDDGGNCLESKLISCYQFMMCPTLPDGSELNCLEAPQIISNSWYENPANFTYFRIMEVMRHAGIVNVFAVGNEGPNCGTASSPGDYNNTIAVGATTFDFKLASFSSKGPARYTNLTKPDISAPGSRIVSASCKADDEYAIYSGTSQACPHVAGVVGLIQSTSGDAGGDLDLDKIKRSLCIRPIRFLNPTGMNCGGIREDVWPNNAFGCGLVNAFNAVKAMNRIKK